MVAPLAVNVAATPAQTVALFTVTVGLGFTVTVATAVFVHPTAEVPVTVYEVVLAGEVLNGFAVEPVDHE